MAKVRQKAKPGEAGAAAMGGIGTIGSRSGVIPFDYRARTRLIFGLNTGEQVGGLAGEWKARKVLLVTDAGIVAAGHAERVQRLLEAANLTVRLYGKARENPTTRDVDDCLAVAKAAGVDTIVGLGGGSSMETAKGCNFLLTNGGR